MLGLVDYNLKDYKCAKQKYCKAIELNPNFPDPLNNIGMVDRLLGNYQDAISAFKRSIIIKPDLLLLDEPFSKIDQNLKDELHHQIKLILKKLKISTIIVTHDTNEAFYLAMSSF